MNEAERPDRDVLAQGTMLGGVVGACCAVRGARCVRQLLLFSGRLATSDEMPGRGCGVRVGHLQVFMCNGGNAQNWMAWMEGGGCRAPTSKPGSRIDIVRLPPSCSRP